MSEDTTPDVVMKITVGGAEHLLRHMEISVALAAALRTQSHGAWRVPTLLRAADDGVGPEELAGLVFLARRQSGEDVTYDRACAELPVRGEAVIEFVDGATLGDADPNV